ncbi:dipeptide ABC transporter ATP-binding protein [Reyranella aquatilis]|uniref:Dipeptide ABC transporter ATP-binding protein n=1 Tax=Reyranella aquatilis TaxID=2035356 RepID=A0ABS8KSA2_9HYPH|nr:dipeptide ABC transporter ATP-binding protein [Reyranella aquatilis]MCC8428538.1 dipeptide ABC transporter ATP-binding protein [Reyranella aquatilis]
MSGPLLEVQGLAKHFPVRQGAFGRLSGHVRAVDGVDFHLNAGETLAIVGESGCGKSTVGRLVLRLLEPTGGSVRFEGQDLLALPDSQMRAQRRRMQIIFQDPYASLNPRMTVGAMLSEPLMLHRLAPSDAARRTRVGELLELVGLRPEHARRYPHEFSGGQRQRLAIARALAVEPQLIVADEPVSALDVSIQAQVINLMRSLQARFGLAYVFISHDLAVVKHIADRIAVMYLGKIVETAATDELFRNPRHPYTRALLSAVPLPDPTVVRERALLEGDIPSAMNPPPGCRFHTRCRFARESCRVDAPLLADDGTGHSTACPWWPELPPAPSLVEDRADDQDRIRLARLQAAFVTSQMEAT